MNSRFGDGQDKVGHQRGPNRKISKFQNFEKRSYRGKFYAKNRFLTVLDRENHSLTLKNRFLPPWSTPGNAKWWVSPKKSIFQDQGVVFTV